ncbi:MAG: hypothetical protein ACREA9_14195 [Pyrinomonadaceae bacterium]
MKAKAVVLSLALCFAATTVVVAKTNPHMGTWKLNEAKSKIAPGGAKNHTVVYEAAGDDIKVIVDGIDGDGNATHNEWTGKFNGRYYPVTGDATSDERSYKVINRHTLLLWAKKGGKVTLTGRVALSMNGKMRTVTTNGTDAKGKRFRTVAVYDKQ